MKEKTRATWLGRIEEWRRSGKTAEEFAAGQPFSGGTLTWRASQLRRRVVPVADQLPVWARHGLQSAVHVVIIARYGHREAEAIGGGAYSDVRFTGE